MATPTVLKGHAVLAKLGTAQEGTIGSKSSELTLTAETADCTTKDDAVGGVLYKNEEVSGTSGSLRVDGLVFAGSDALTFDIGDTVECEFVCGKRKYAFTGLVANLTFTGSVDDNATYSATVNSKGKITKSAVS